MDLGLRSNKNSNWSADNLKKHVTLMSCTRYSQATLIRESITASSSGALFLAWFRIERETRVTGDEPQETMGRVKKREATSGYEADGCP